MTTGHEQHQVLGLDVVDVSGYNNTMIFLAQQEKSLLNPTTSMFLLTFAIFVGSIKMIAQNPKSKKIIK